MKKTNLLINFKSQLKNKGLSLTQFCDKFQFDKNQLRHFVSQRIISMNDPILSKLASALECEIENLFSSTKNSQINKPANESQQYRRLFNSFNNIDIDLFYDSVARIDEVFSANLGDIDSKERAKAYIAFYELANNLRNMNENFS